MNDLPEIRKLDLQVHGFSRHAFIDQWVLGSETRKSLVCIENNTVVGFGTIRQCLEGLKVGPLIAPSFESAQLLISALSKLFGEKEIVLDVPEPNGNANRFAESLKLKVVFETARMYRGNAPEYKLDKL